MAKPPETPPSSDIAGVNRDARAGTPSKHPEPNGAAQSEAARDNSAGRPPRSGSNDPRP